MTPDEFIDEWHNPLPYITAHTSGSTGSPKEIVLPKRLVAESARRTINYFGLTSESHLHLPLSPDYIAGKMMIVRALLANAAITYEKPSNVLCGIPDDHLTDLIAVVPSQLDFLLDHPSMMRNIRNIIVGGSPLNTTTREKSQIAQCNIVETYGMTETASHVALRNVRDNYFTPLPGIKILCDSEKRIIIDMGEYGIVKTNDIGEFRQDGSFKVIGRIDDVIITGALKVHPADVERRISYIIDRLFPGAAFAISSIPDEKWVNRIVLYIEGNPPEEYGKRSEVKILSELMNLLNYYEIPKQIFFIKSFPRTSSGKILRNSLKNLCSSN